MQGFPLFLLQAAVVVAVGALAWFHLGTALVFVQLASAIAIVILVLLQHGKGADMGAAFGSGTSGSLFGATGSANFLSSMTSSAAAVFFAATLGLAYVATTQPKSAGSVMQTAPATATTPTAPAVPGGAASPASTTTPAAVASPAASAPASAPAAAPTAVPGGAPTDKPAEPK
jgi:preprotein translocase subunit SecG